MALIGALPLWLLRAPEFKVLWAVVVTNTIEMVDVFVLFEGPPEHPAHHEPVLKHVSRTGPHCGKGVIWCHPSLVGGYASNLR